MDTNRASGAMQDIAATIANCDFPHPFGDRGTGYGRVLRSGGTEQDGPHTLPVAIFAGGKRVALYQVRDSEGQWLRVYR